MRSIVSSISLLGLGVVIFLTSLAGLWNPLYGATTTISVAVFGDIRPGVQNAQQALDLARGYSTLAEQNQHLRNDNFALQTQLWKVQADLEQLSWLEGQLKLMPRNSSLALGVAQVLTQESVPVPGYLYVRAVRGEINVGDYIVSGGVLLGEVVGDQGSVMRVKMFAAGDSRVGVRIGKNVVGNLQGTGTTEPTVGEVDSGVRIKSGTSIFLLNPRTPLGRIFPLGKVTGEISRGVDAQKTFRAKVPVDLDTLNFVFVLSSHAK